MVHADKVYRLLLKLIFKIHKCYQIYYKMISFDVRININLLIFRKWNKTAYKCDAKWKNNYIYGCNH